MIQSNSLKSNSREYNRKIIIKFNEDLSDLDPQFNFATVIVILMIRNLK